MKYEKNVYSNLKIIFSWTKYGETMQKGKHLIAFNISAIEG